MAEEPKNDAAPIDHGADFAGMVNSAGSLFLNGWAVTREGDPCLVKVFIDGVEVFSMMSEEERGHLVRRNASKGLGGWSVDLRKLLKPGPNRIDVRVPNGKSLRRSPFIHHAPPTVRPLAAGEARLYQGHAEMVGEDALRGWVMGPGGDTAVVTVHVNGREPVSFLADQPRIETVGDTQRTVFGWSISLSDVLMPGMNVIEVRDAEGRPLGASPFLQRIRRQPAAAPAPAKPEPPKAAPAPAKPEPASAAAAAPAKPEPASAAAPAPAKPEPANAAAPAPAKPEPASAAAAAPVAKPAAEAPAPAPTPAPAPEKKEEAVASSAEPASAPAPTPPSAPPPEPAPEPVLEPVAQPATMPSAADLDELSLDDISLAMAGGMVTVETPVAPPVPPVEAVPRPAPVDRFREAPGFFERLFGRKR